MTQNSHLLPSDFGLNSFQELIYQPPNRAGDHLDDLDAFRDALLTDLAPIRPDLRPKFPPALVESLI